MNSYRCNLCGYIYDPAKGDGSSVAPAGTSFESLPEDWACPLCGVDKKEFEADK